MELETCKCSKHEPRHNQIGSNKVDTLDWKLFVWSDRKK